MGVRVYTARHDVLAARVDNLVCLHVQGLSYERNRFVLDKDIAHVIVGGGDDPAVLDEHRHCFCLLCGMFL